MTPERWASIKELYTSAVDLPESERTAFLDDACAEDTGLRLEVERLLEAGEAGLTCPLPDLLAVGPAPGLAPGRMLGRYRVDQPVGQGGMGSVYRAFDTQLDRTVAVKVLPPEYSLNPARRSRFLREARAASAISHPNVIGIYEAGIDDGIAFIAMEFVEGRSLDQVIPARGLPVRQALDFAIGIADGLAKAHAGGVVHRDLKPRNIMVTPEGAVKLLDFGLAKRVVLGATRDPALTTAGEILGTPAYMSPEQAEGKSVDARSDIFSFGAVLYEMLSGRRAFRGDSAIAILGAVLREEPPPLTRLPDSLARLVARCLRKDPARRVQHMEDVRLLLEDAREALSAPSVRRPRPLRISLLAALAGLAAGFCLAALFFLTPAGPPAGGRYTPFATEAVAETMPAWSPDGKSIAYLASFDGIDQVFTRALGSPASVRITQSPSNCGPPFW